MTACDGSVMRDVTGWVSRLTPLFMRLVTACDGMTAETLPWLLRARAFISRACARVMGETAVILSLAGIWLITMGVQSVTAGVSQCVCAVTVLSLGGRDYMRLSVLITRPPQRNLFLTYFLYAGSTNVRFGRVKSDFSDFPLGANKNMIFSDFDLFQIINRHRVGTARGLYSRLRSISHIRSIRHGGNANDER